MKLQLNGLVYTTDNQSKIDRLLELGAKEIKVPTKEVKKETKKKK